MKRLVILAFLILTIFSFGNVSAFNGDFEVFVNSNDSEHTFSGQDWLEIKGYGEVTDRFGTRQELVDNKSVLLNIEMSCFDVLNNSLNLKQMQTSRIEATFDGTLYEGLIIGTCKDIPSVYNGVDFGRGIFYNGNFVQKSD